MRALRDLLPLGILLLLLCATALNLLAVTQLRGWPLAIAVVTLSWIKAKLIILGFMRLQRDSSRMGHALTVYVCSVALLAGLRIVLIG